MEKQVSKMAKEGIIFHNLDQKEVAAHWRTDIEKGLSNDEVDKRLKEFGKNKLKEHEGVSAFKIFILQFHQPLIYILIAASVITAILGEFTDSLVIIGVVILNAMVGYIQESKATKALDELSKSLTTNANVIRNGEKISISSDELVPGDIVLLGSGDRVPADLRIIEVKDLQVQESALTGESVPVQKKPVKLDVEMPLADRLNMAYSSTLVTSGTGKGIVTQTGEDTEIGKISEMISNVITLDTPLTKKIHKFSMVLLYMILGLAAISFGLGVYRGESMVDMFLASVALAVAAIPEALPAAITTVMAIGVARMAKRNAIIRKLPVVETLGSATVICSDKTGTLTENQMTVQKIYSGGLHFDVEGTGYKPEGKVLMDGKEYDIQSNRSLRECLIAGVLCNDSKLVEEDGQYKINGDPTEGCMTVLAIKAGLEPAEILLETPRIDTIPFESERQYMATLHKTQHGNVAYIKGSIEKLLEKMDSFMDVSGEERSLDKELISRKADELANQGLRVIALAKKSIDSQYIIEDSVADGCVFIGLQGIIDPPREEVIAAIKACQEAGIVVKMITGDHALTAKNIAGRLNIYNEKARNDVKAVYTGSELARLSPAEFDSAAKDTNVFARVTPEQKLMLVKSLQKNGNVVAMTGDGVNDAPALKQADIGIAMGITGTEVTKEVADMVLTDDNFSSIEAAVEEGRGVYENLTKFIVWTIPTNFGEGFVILVAIFMGLTLPILPIQILWINMTTAVFLGLTLAFEPKEPDIMKRKPADPDRQIITPYILFKIIFVGIILLVSSFYLFNKELQEGDSVEKARTLAVTVFVVIQTFYLINSRSFNNSLIKIGLFSNIWLWAGIVLMIGLQLLFIYAPFMNRIFNSTPIGWDYWVQILIVGVASFIIIEIEKVISRRFFKK